MDEPIVTRKKKWEYVPPPETRWHLEQPLKHPDTGSEIFGVLPPVIHAQNTIFAGGDIVLRYGKHVGNRHSQNGFGFRHIWSRRFYSIADHDSAMVAVTEFVASIIQPGTRIYWEEGIRVAVFCGVNGEVIVEERGDPGSQFYSVVTAIKHPVSPKGSLLGTL